MAYLPFLDGAVPTGPIFIPRARHASMNTRGAVCSLRPPCSVRQPRRIARLREIKGPKRKLWVAQAEPDQPKSTRSVMRTAGPSRLFDAGLAMFVRRAGTQCSITFR